MSAVPDDRVATVGDAPRAGVPALVVAWGPVALWLAVIFALSSDRFSDVNTAVWFSAVPLVGALVPQHAIELGNFIVRKCAHFVEYAILSMLTYRALRATRPHMSGPRLVAAAVGMAVVCAALDEVHQYFGTFTRSGSPRDVLLDAFGSGAGALVGASYLYRRARRPVA
jgi:VanZ family protein